MRNKCPRCQGQKDVRAQLCRYCRNQELVTERTCTYCKILKDVSEFRIRTRKNPRPRSKCKECERKLARERAREMDPTLLKANRDAARKTQSARKRAALRNLKRRFPEAWESILEMKQSMIHCQICGNEKVLVVDHDHVTGKFRGLLCNSCNTALGKFHDDPVVLRKAIKYLVSKPA